MKGRGGDASHYLGRVFLLVKQREREVQPEKCRKRAKFVTALLFLHMEWSEGSSWLALKSKSVSDAGSRPHPKV